MELFTTDEFKSLTAKQRAILLYDELIKTIVTGGIRKDENAVASGLQEIVAILRCDDLKPRVSGTQGCDALTRDNRTVDIKVCDTGFDRPANLNLRLPVSVEKNYSLDDDPAALYWHIYQTQMKKCEILRFQYRSTLTVDMDGVFVAAALCKYYEQNHTRAINWSGKFCKKCKHIHRIKHITSYEKNFLDEVAKCGNLDAKKWHRLITDSTLWVGFFDKQTKDNCQAPI